jgi:hypothetical protein
VRKKGSIGKGEWEYKKKGRVREGEEGKRRVWVGGGG